MNATPEIDVVNQWLQPRFPFWNMEAAVVTLLVLEYFHHLDSEITLVWPDKFGFVKFVFLSNRYITLLTTLILTPLGIILATNPSEEICRAMFILPSVIAAICLSLSEIILFLRVWAMSNRSWWFAVSLGTFWIGMTSSLITICIKSSVELKFEPNSVSGAVCVPGQLDSGIMCIPFVLILVEQIFIMTMCTFFSAKRFWFSRNRLIRTLWWDGACYFTSLSALSILNVTVNLLSPGLFLLFLLVPQGLAHSILSTRLFLHLRKASRENPPSTYFSGIVQEGFKGLDVFPTSIKSQHCPGVQVC